MAEPVNEGPQGLIRRELEMEDFPYRRLCCPRCGNRGEATFSAMAIVLIGGDGLPEFLCPYPAADHYPRVDCHGCDYMGPLEAFTDRHRPGERTTHRRKPA